jgi:regulator of cell morphogenesis and NO signaling
MSSKFNVNDKVGTIVTVFPGASDIFYKYNIDFCCGGDRPLVDAINEQKLNESKVMTELNDKYEEFSKQSDKYTDWAKESPAKLIDYVVNKHHVYLKEELPIINELLLKIMKVISTGSEVFQQI